MVAMTANFQHILKYVNFQTDMGSKKNTAFTDAIVEKYATKILSALPPKQATLYRDTIIQSCEHLFLEAQVSVKERQFSRLEKFLSVIDKLPNEHENDTDVQL